MSTPETYDVAVIGYGPTGATAANLLGQLGLKVLVVERDPDVYGRARAISTDEEFMRVWQSVGLADRLQQDMLPDRPLNFVDADGVPFIDMKVASRGTGHPPQQFLHTGAPPAGAQAWTDLGVPTIRITEPTLVRWLQRKKAAAVVMRPDGFIYAAAESGQPLSAPPAITPITTGVSA